MLVPQSLTYFPNENLSHNVIQVLFVFNLIDLIERFFAMTNFSYNIQVKNKSINISV